MPARQDDLVVVVPAWQAEATIGACVEALWRAGAVPGSVIVVDDASPDGTAAAAEAAGARVVRAARNIGAAGARNLGAATSLAPLIAFVDADVLVAPDALVRLRARLVADPGLAAVFGSYDARPAARGRVSRIRNLLHRHVHQAEAGEATTFWTGLGAVRRTAFEAVGGFDPAHRDIEDVRFGQALWRAGLRIALDPGIEGSHLKRWTLAGMARTDLIHRAIPWSRMLLAPDEGLRPPGRLAAGRAARASVAAVALGLAGLLVAPFAPLAGLGALAAGLLALAWLNRGFLARLRREGEPGDAAAAIGVLAVHYGAAGLGFALCLLRLDGLVAGHAAPAG